MAMNSAIRFEDFEGMLRVQKRRKTMITEGDSWFGYPASQVPVRHTGTNIIDHLEKTKRFNILRMESSGDEAGAMMSQVQRHKFHDVLSRLKAMKKEPDYILFSAGGNDIVGEHDMMHFLNRWESGMTAEDCIRDKRFNLRLEQIRLAYEELILFRDEYCDQAHIITHGYDNPIPTNKKAKFIFGIVQVKPWIKPYMDQKKVPLGAMQEDVVSIMIARLNKMLDQLCTSTSRMLKVETVGTLKKGDWRDEIHANKQGFKKIAGKFLQAIDNIESQQV
jgi:lysophospholipase L1-like esterase